MRTTKAAQASATKQKLEHVARELFAERGFAAVSAEELVAEAGVTRGALYHHYDGKQGLFEAVVETTMRDLHARLSREAAAASNPLDALLRGVGVFLKFCTEPAFNASSSSTLPRFSVGPNGARWTRDTASASSSRRLRRR